VIAVLIWYGYWRKLNLPLAVLGLILVTVNTAWISMLAAIASARFRDIPPIVGSVTQFAMFLTPVFWMPSSFPSRHAFLALNPFYHMLQAIRAPLLGQSVDPLTWAVLAGLAVAGWAVTFSIFALTRRRIVHYL